MQTLILTIHIILAICITIFVLLQRSEGGALGALGGGQGGSGLFSGRQAGNFLSRMTAYLFVAFIITSLSLVLMAKNSDKTEQIKLVPVAADTNMPANPMSENSK